MAIPRRFHPVFLQLATSLFLAINIIKIFHQRPFLYPYLYHSSYPTIHPSFIIDPADPHLHLLFTSAWPLGFPPHLLISIVVHIPTTPIFTPSQPSD
jgi:hypothetical protein